MNIEIANQILYWYISAWLKMNKDVVCEKKLISEICITTYLQVILLGHMCQSDTGVQVQTCHSLGYPQSPGGGKKGKSSTAINPHKTQYIQAKS